MKKRLQGFAAGVMVTLMLTGVFAIAKSLYEKIDVLYNDIKIEIDGEEFVATDVNGNVVEPFIYNGTTYLPVRAIATAFDKDVAWDEETYTVSLTTKEKTVTEEKVEGETTEENVPEYGNNLTDEQLHGTWYGDVTKMLADAGVPESIARKYNIWATFKFDADGSYEVYFSEEAIDALVDAAFEYSLLANGITIEDYPQFSGVSVEDTKAQIRGEIMENDFHEKGTYRVENGVLYTLVEGNSEKVQNYTFEDGVLTFYEDDAKMNLTREIIE